MIFGPTKNNEKLFTNKAINRQREILSEEFKLGSLKVELSVQTATNHFLNAGGYHVYLFAKDENDRRLWSTAIIDDLRDGIKVYASVDEAVLDAKKKLGLSPD